MPRCKSILQSEFPYHVTARCINKEWFLLPMDLVWEIFCDELHFACILYGIKIHGFVLLNNHFHLIVSTPLANISESMYGFLKNVSKRLTLAGNRINQTFAGRHYKTILHTQSYFLNTYKYIYLNPVRANIVSRAEEYKYSTLQGLLGFSKLLVPIEEDLTLFSDVESTLNWINSMPNEEKLEAVKWGLKRQYFKPRKQVYSNKPILQKDEII